MVFRRLALIVTLLAALGSACGTSQVSKGSTPPVKSTTIQTPTAAPASLATAARTPANAVELPLDKSPRHEVDVFFRNPDYFTRMLLAEEFDRQVTDPELIRYAEGFARYTNVAPTVYLMYMWANYPTGTYPNVEQFMRAFFEAPGAYGHAAEEWLDSDPCTWPVEVQEQVVAIEQSSPGRLRASVTTAIHPAWMADPAVRAITIGARGQFYDDREAYLDQFRCTVKGGKTADRTPIARATAAKPVATATPIPKPTPSTTSVAERLDNPREPGLAREILVSYLAEKLQEEAPSANVQNIANRLDYLTESAPLVLEMYIAVGLMFTVEDEPVFYSAFLVHPGCVVSHPSLIEGQTTAFATDISRRWPDVNPLTMPGLAEAEQLTDAQMQEFCRQFNDWIETRKPR